MPNVLSSLYHLNGYICRGASLLYGKEILIGIKRKTPSYPALTNKDDKR